MEKRNIIALRTAGIGADRMAQAKAQTVYLPVAPPAQSGLIKTLFIVTELAIGGAEMMLFRVLSRLDRRRYNISVISLRGPGPIADRLLELDIPVYSLNWRSLDGTPGAVRNLRRSINALQPDLIQGWMLHANAATLVQCLPGGKKAPVIWNVRHSLHDYQGLSRTTVALTRLLGYVSSWPQRIVFNSQTSARQHEKAGYDPRRTVVIPNGFDCDVLSPNPRSRAIVRAQLGLTEDGQLIGLFARVHPVKDHANFLSAAERLVSRGGKAHFLMVGRGTEEQNMTARIAAHALSGRVHVLGERTNVAELLPALDVATSCSMAEAFPNAVGEAMACGVPCVVTDVGDSAFLVGNTGRIVPRGDSVALAGAWEDVLALSPGERRELGQAARTRILEQFSLNEIVKRYEAMYSELVPVPAACPRVDSLTRGPSRNTLT